MAASAGAIREVVVATDADLEGELTALHIIKGLQPYPVKISRIGVGLPAGGSVEFADISTLTMSLNARRDVAAPGQGIPERSTVSIVDA